MMKRYEVRLGDAAYPASLEDLESPPDVLYVVGDPAALSERSISIIGARRATPYGLAAAEMAGRVAAECGVTVVSGGARGCDAAGLRAATKAGGRTVVVSGTGADIAYPKSSCDVFSAAANNGCVVSLAPWGTQPQPWAFPKRNRIIAALAQALYVTEAGERSGTAITADFAEEIGRSIYAVPGSIFSPESLGSNRLIANGAAIIVSEEDLETRIALDFGVTRLVMQGQGYHPSRVLSALRASPMRPDDLANRLGKEPLEILRMLADYEASGVVTRLMDGRYAVSRDMLLTRDRIEKTPAVVCGETEEGMA